MQHELEKLYLYAGDEPRLTVAHVEMVVHFDPQEDIFKMVGAVVEGHPERALPALNRLLGLGQPPQVIVSLLQRQYRLIHQAKCLMDCGYRLHQIDRVPKEVREALPSDGNLVDTLRRLRFLAGRIGNQAKALTWDALERSWQLIFDADMGMKGMGSVQDPVLACELLVTNLCRAARSARRR